MIDEVAEAFAQAAYELDGEQLAKFNKEKNELARQVGIMHKTLELISLVRVLDDPEKNKMKLQAVINAAKDAISYK